MILLVIVLQQVRQLLNADWSDLRLYCSEAMSCAGIWPAWQTTVVIEPSWACHAAEGAHWTRRVHCYVIIASGAERRCSVQCAWVLYTVQPACMHVSACKR